VQTSSVHGSGLFASRNIAAEQHVGVYEGRRYGADDERAWDPRLVYAFRLSDGTVIDGCEGGNESRHINHSCESNCAAYEVEHEDGSLAIASPDTSKLRSSRGSLLCRPDRHRVRSPATTPRRIAPTAVSR
jgi:SET domain-containing protein